MDRRRFLAVGAVVPVVAGTVGISGDLFAVETYTSIAEAGDLYRLQGEYLGVVESLDGTWGAQVIATGEKALEVHLLKGGLPGDGFKSKEPTRVCKVERLESSLAKGKGSDYGVSLDGKTLTVTNAEGKVLGELTKVVRESKTLGLEPPKGAMVLFDGTTADRFEGGKMVEQKYLGVGCKSKDTFGDHRLHLEFRTPFQPSDSGQGRGNSGVYIQGRYELQVLDSFGLRGENNECGGIYQIASPSLNMCYPPLSWQTYDIDFKSARYGADGKKTSNARVTIRHNGVVIHDDLEFPRGTPGGVGDEAPQGGPLYLQDHSNPVVFRNIWVSKSE